MNLTTENLVSRRKHLNGEQLIYRLGDYGLSVVNGEILHSYPFAWEVAVLKFKGPTIEEFDLTYETPLTNDVEVFSTDKETNDFIQAAFIYFGEVEG